jgi:ABC-type multidrug transport system ATPase subunit
MSFETKQLFNCFNIMQNEQIINVRNLSKRFGSFEAVRDVSFSVNSGDVFGFLGPNGAGKSTTIRCLLSLIKPDNGMIELFGKSYSNQRSAILTNVGSIIEKPDFYKYLSAQKNLEIFARISGADVSKRSIQEMLDFVGLGDRGNHKVKGFSHGMKQRLGIAQTLLHNPDLIILDEPTTGLDPQGIIEIRNLILRLKTEQKKTVLLSSHQLSEIELIADRMVIINKGKTIVEGNVIDLLNAEDLVVRIETDDSNATVDIIHSVYSELDIRHINSREVEISTKKNMVHRLNELLVKADMAVHAIEPKRKLEDYFMNVISSEHVD